MPPRLVARTASLRRAATAIAGSALPPMTNESIAPYRDICRRRTMAWVEQSQKKNAFNSRMLAQRFGQRRAPSQCADQNIRPSLCNNPRNGDINPVKRHFSGFLRQSSYFAQQLSNHALLRKRIRKHLRDDSWFTISKQGTCPKGLDQEEKKMRVGCPR
ncbi:MAG: hypothetical protein EOQ98_27915, partial [Mesorhizobium sp.]|uniref:hypothetical protein n=1 Tax=Mesorhizobium sp. TaxID=1871066 RepID=UPI000FE532E0